MNQEKIFNIEYFSGLKKLRMKKSNLRTNIMKNINVIIIPFDRVQKCDFIAVENDDQNLESTYSFSS